MPWYGSNIDTTQGFTAEQADYIESKYSQLVQNGIIDLHSGFPKLESHLITDTEEEESGRGIWDLTSDAVRRYKYVPDPDENHDPDDDIDPLVWQCRERNNKLCKVDIKRLSQVSAQHRSAITDEERERIIWRSYMQRSTIVLPEPAPPATAIPKPAKIVNNAEKRPAQEVGPESQTEGVELAPSSKRKADDQPAEASAPTKRARTEEANAAETEDQDNDEAITAKAIAEMKRTAPRTWAAMVEMKELEGSSSMIEETSEAAQDGAIALRTTAQKMRKEASHSLATRTNIEEPLATADLETMGISTDTETQATASKNPATKAARNAEGTNTRKSSRQVVRPQSYVKRRRNRKNAEEEAS